MSATLTTSGVPLDPGRVNARWGASLGLVLVAHACIGWLLLRHSTAPPLEATPPAIIIDLTPPEPASEPEPAPEAPPPPPEPAAEPPPPEPASPEPPPPPEAPIQEAVPLPEPPKVLRLPPPPKPPVAKPPPPRPQPIQQQVAPAPVNTPPVAAPPAAAATSTASRQAAAAATTSWQGRLQAHLARFKQYPADAQMRHHEGTATVRFTMTRAGKVLSYALVNSSGHELLDREALALIERAQPLPPLPDEVPQATIQLVLPLSFHLH